MNSSQLQFFLDFDGTVTKNDVVDLILDRFASKEWKTIEQEWVDGKIGSRECLSRQIALVSASKEALSRLITEVEIDSHFVSFLKRAKNYGIPVTIVSDGFRNVIEEVLKRHLKDSPELLEDLPIFSNDLRWEKEKLKVVFPEGPVCEHTCANCKPQVITRHRVPGEKIVFVGDGLSDRFAAAVSDFTFAKSKLLKFCEENKINHQKYSTFKELDEWIVRQFEKRSSEKQTAKPYLVERN